MKKVFVLIMAVPLAVWIAQASDFKSAQESTVTRNGGAPSDNCAGHLRMYNDDYRSSLRDEETRSVPNQPLTITAARNGGIEVTTWDHPEFSIKLCKQAAADDDAAARKTLSETKLVIEGGNVSISTPNSDDYHSLGTLLLVKAPRNAALNLNVRNGGISLDRFAGTAEARAENGGISFRESSGKLTAKAENGGVSIKDCGGEVDASVQNGGLSIALPEHWDGKGLDARARNGGLVVAVPKNFSGGLEVTGSEHVPIVCKDNICEGGERTWDHNHKIFRLGGANPQIHASTENGGIVIKERGSSSRVM